jgi:hypothetical protein
MRSLLRFQFFDQLSDLFDTPRRQDTCYHLSAPVIGWYCTRCQGVPLNRNFSPRTFEIVVLHILPKLLAGQSFEPISLGYI